MIRTQQRLLTIPEWFDVMERGLGRYPGLTYLEQAMYQSEKRKACIECLSTDNLVHQTGRVLIKSTDYYMCQPCLDWMEEKHREEQEVTT